MEFLILLVVLGSFASGNGNRCELVLQKDGNIIEDGEHVVGFGGDINQIYCKALCSGPGPTPALKWYREPRTRPISWFRGRVYQVRTTFERVSILTIRNMLYRDTATYRCRGWLKDVGWQEKSFELVYGCKDSGHLCDTSKCISQAQICDGEQQCKDGTDEQNCLECKINQFHCDDGDCIQGDMRCDGFFDCVDGSDEYNCGCSPDFTCSQGGCVSQDKVCDGTSDCMVGEDEVNCTYCEDDEFHCGQSECIAAELVCNGWDDCAGGSDETTCPLQVKIENPQQDVFEGETVRFTCVVTQSSTSNPYDLKWSRQGGELPLSASVEENTLVIPGVKTLDAGIYICTGEDRNTVDKAEAELSVTERCPGSYGCLDGSCISTESVCDMIQDCPSGDDESDCEYCTVDEFHCGDTSCITIDQVCDGQDDCNNGTDEEDCCIGRYQCLDGKCLETDDECDGFPDCSDGEDEVNCTYCEIDEYHCGAGECIPEYELCDRVQQCEDGSDELNCGCYDDYTCSDGTCIDVSKVCDGSIDCNGDGGDELDCKTCSEGFLCTDGSRCISTMQVCDGKQDCDDGWDENDCQTPACYTDSFRCDESECVDKTAKCNGTIECSNEADERDCADICDADSEFTCASKDQCIPTSWRCDGSADCTDSSDECGCSSEEFVCEDKMCISIDSKCDGVPDCAGEEDETDCEQVVCPEGMRMCTDGSRCITSMQVCDGTENCDDGLDESEDICGAPSKDVN